jgi:hypothetical protein
MLVRQILVFHLLMLSTAFCFGATWSVHVFGGPDDGYKKRTQNDREGLNFKVDGIPCYLSGTRLDKIDIYIFEMRYLVCNVAKDLSVRIDMSYNVKSSDILDSRSLTLNKNGVASTIMISVR